MRNALKQSFHGADPSCHAARVELEPALPAGDSAFALLPPLDRRVVQPPHDWCHASRRERRAPPLTLTALASPSRHRTYEPKLLPNKTSPPRRLNIHPASLTGARTSTDPRSFARPSASLTVARSSSMCLSTHHLPRNCAQGNSVSQLYDMRSDKEERRAGGFPPDDDEIVGLAPQVL